MLDNQLQNHTVNIPLKITYTTYGNLKRAKKLIILLHGYSQTGKIFFDRIQSILPQENYIIAINGIFPMPGNEKTLDSLRYAWYFFDAENDHYIIDFQTPATAISELINDLNLAHLPLDIIGYSQGGYLAPFVAQKLTHTQKCIGINCNFRSDFLSPPFNFEILAIHGAEDSIVDIKKSKINFDKLISAGAKGEYFIIEGENHSLRRDIIQQLGQVINTGT